MNTPLQQERGNSIMILKCNNSYIQQAVSYIGEGKLQCFYLYMDMIKYGAERPEMGLWISEVKGEIRGVAYRYFDTIHLYSREVFPLQDALELINELLPKCVTGSQKTIDRIFGQTAKPYTYELSHIITANRFMEEKPGLKIEQAALTDVPEIAALMMKDHIYYEVYTYEKLCTQLQDRIETGFGRLFIIRNDLGRLVATNATYAEVEDMAVIGGLITDPDLRGQGLGRAITASTWNLVRTEGKRGLAFLAVNNEKTVIMHQKMGYEFLGQYARLLKDE